MEELGNSAVDFNMEAYKAEQQNFGTDSGPMLTDMSRHQALPEAPPGNLGVMPVVPQPANHRVQIEVTEAAEAARVGKGDRAKPGEEGEEKENLDGSLTDVQWVAQLESKGHECLLSPKISLKSKRRTACGLEEEEDMPLGKAALPAHQHLLPMGPPGCGRPRARLPAAPALLQRGLPVLGALPRACALAPMLQPLRATRARATPTCWAHPAMARAASPSPSLTCAAAADPRFQKPQCSYASLITSSIRNSKDKKLTLNGIYEWIMKNYPYYEENGKGWKVRPLTPPPAAHPGTKKLAKLRRRATVCWPLSSAVCSFSFCRTHWHKGSILTARCVCLFFLPHAELYPT